MEQQAAELAQHLAASEKHVTALTARVEALETALESERYKRDALEHQLLQTQRDFHMDLARVQSQFSEKLAAHLRALPNYTQPLTSLTRDNPPIRRNVSSWLRDGVPSQVEQITLRLHPTNGKYDIELRDPTPQYGPIVTAIFSMQLRSQGLMEGDELFEVDGIDVSRASARGALYTLRTDPNGSRVVVLRALSIPQQGGIGARDRPSSSPKVGTLHQLHLPDTLRRASHSDSGPDLLRQQSKANLTPKQPISSMSVGAAPGPASTVTTPPSAYHEQQLHRHRHILHRTPQRALSGASKGLDDDDDASSHDSLDASFAAEDDMRQRDGMVGGHSTDGATQGTNGTHDQRVTSPMLSAQSQSIQSHQSVDRQEPMLLQHQASSASMFSQSNPQHNQQQQQQRQQQQHQQQRYYQQQTYRSPQQQYPPFSPMFTPPHHQQYPTQQYSPYQQYAGSPRTQDANHGQTVQAPLQVNDTAPFGSGTELDIEVRRVNNSLGFSVLGLVNQQDNACTLYVIDARPHCALHVGDTLLRIGDQPLAGLTKQEQQTLIKSAGDVLHAHISRPENPSEVVAYLKNMNQHDPSVPGTPVGPGTPHTLHQRPPYSPYTTPTAPQPFTTPTPPSSTQLSKPPATQKLEVVLKRQHPTEALGLKLIPHKSGRGVVISGVYDGKLAAKTALCRRGDIIISVNGQDTTQTTVDDAMQYLTAMEVHLELLRPSAE
eukprot:m.281511 g.281511  ORF g.281511 m.281511 type:complete len:717 (+) comp15751_c7_seq1:109-2259(+)